MLFQIIKTNKNKIDSVNLSRKVCNLQFIFKKIKRIAIGLLPSFFSLDKIFIIISNPELNLIHLSKNQKHNYDDFFEHSIVHIPNKKTLPRGKGLIVL